MSRRSDELASREWLAYADALDVVRAHLESAESAMDAVVGFDQSKHSGVAISPWHVRGGIGGYVRHFEHSAAVARRRGGAG